MKNEFSVRKHFKTNTFASKISISFLKVLKSFRVLSMFPNHSSSYMIWCSNKRNASKPSQQSYFYFKRSLLFFGPSLMFCFGQFIEVSNIQSLFCFRVYPINTRRCFDVHATSITLKRRRTDVKITSRAYWVFANLCGYQL